MHSLLWPAHPQRRLACLLYHQLRGTGCLCAPSGLTAHLGLTLPKSQAFLAAKRAGEAVGLPVRGGLWEVDLAARRMACACWLKPQGAWSAVMGLTNT